MAIIETTSIEEECALFEARHAHLFEVVSKTMKRLIIAALITMCIGALGTYAAEPEGEQMDESTITLELTEAERIAINDATRRDGFGIDSEKWLRQLALRSAEPLPIPTVTPDMTNILTDLHQREYRVRGQGGDGSFTNSGKEILESFVTATPGTRRFAALIKVLELKVGESFAADFATFERVK